MDHGVTMRFSFDIHVFWSKLLEVLRFSPRSTLASVRIQSFLIAHRRSRRVLAEAVCDKRRLQTCRLADTFGTHGEGGPPQGFRFVNRTETVHGTLRFLYLSHLLYGICVKIFIMNRYISKSYRTSKNTVDRQQTERGQL